MSRFLPAMLALFACSPPDATLQLSASDPLWEGLPSDQAAPPPYEMTLSAGNFLEGRTARFQLTGVPIGVPVHVAWSTLLGNGPCPAALGGRCLDLAGPVHLVPATFTSTTGALSLSFTVPANSFGTTMSVQFGVVGATPALSNPVQRLIGSPGKPVNPNVDGDGDLVTINQGDCADHQGDWGPREVDVPGDGLDVNCDNRDGAVACPTNPCFAGVSCQLGLGGAPVCGTCPSGLAGDGLTCVEDDACAAGPCFPGVSCADIPAPGMGYTCGVCPPGTSGDGAWCEEINGCADSPCFAGVACSDVAAPGEGFTCGPCPEGTVGDGVSCELADACAPSPCYPGSTCDLLAEGGAVCGPCPAGMVGNGITCTTPTSCASNPCFAGVACTDGPGGPTCGACPSGFAGDGITCVAEACLPTPCFLGVACSLDGAGDPTCGACPPGMTGDGVTCVNVDSCAANTCYPGVVCIDLLPPQDGYTCGACPPGMTGDGHTCAELDSCSPNPCFVGVSCTDAPAPSTSFSCGPCPPGYEGDGITCSNGT